MKRCPECHEKFEDKFNFCPNDSTRLPTFIEVPLEPIKLVEESTKENELFSNFSLEYEWLTVRLWRSLKEVAQASKLTWPEFKRDPFGFLKRVGTVYAHAFASSWFETETVAGRKRLTSESKYRISAVVTGPAIILMLVGLVFFLEHRNIANAKVRDNDLELTQIISDIPNSQPTPDLGTAGMAKGHGGGSKPKQEKAGGGGGGGRQELKPASTGKLPQADLKIPQVVAPDPHPPVVKNPALPMPATLDADPALFPPDTKNLNYGDPKSKSTDPSSGPGTGNGIGDGKGGGVGPGNGGGYGPGNGGNTGGGDRHEGGGGPGGGGGGTDYSKVFSGKDVNSKAKILEKPEPQYTEAARKNQITGTVIIRAVFSSSGQVTTIVAVSKLPDGLTEKAIEAARKIKFIPATKDGHPVSMYMQLEYNFNLY